MLMHKQGMQKGAITREAFLRHHHKSLCSLHSNTSITMSGVRGRLSKKKCMAVFVQSRAKDPVPGGKHGGDNIMHLFSK